MHTTKIQPPGVNDVSRVRVFRIVFVCAGNVCRSPFAELIMKRELERRPVRGIDVVSAGTLAPRDEPMDPQTLRSAGRHGLDGAGHRSKILDVEILRGVDVVVVLDGQVAEAVRRLCDRAGVRPRVIVEHVLNPWRCPPAAHEMVFYRLSRICDTLAAQVEHGA